MAVEVLFKAGSDEVASKVEVACDEVAVEIVDVAALFPLETVIPDAASAIGVGCAADCGAMRFWTVCTVECGVVI